MAYMNRPWPLPVSVPNAYAGQNQSVSRLLQSASYENVSCYNCLSKLSFGSTFKVESGYYCDVFCYCELERPGKNVVVCIQCRALFAVPVLSSMQKCHKNYLVCSSHCLETFIKNHPHFCVGCGEFYSWPLKRPEVKYCSRKCREEVEGVCCACGSVQSQTFLSPIELPDGRLKYCCADCSHDFNYSLFYRCSFCNEAPPETHRSLMLQFKNHKTLLFCNASCLRDFFEGRIKQTPPPPVGHMDPSHLNIVAQNQNVTSTWSYSPYQPGMPTLKSLPVKPLPLPHPNSASNSETDSSILFLDDSISSRANTKVSQPQGKFQDNKVELDNDDDDDIQVISPKPHEWKTSESPLPSKVSSAIESTPTPPNRTIGRDVSTQVEVSEPFQEAVPLTTSGTGASKCEKSVQVVSSTSYDDKEKINGVLEEKKSVLQGDMKTQAICEACGCTILYDRHPTFCVSHSGEHQITFFCSRKCKKQHLTRWSKHKNCMQCGLKKPIEEEFTVANGTKLLFCSQLCLHLYKENYLRNCGLVLSTCAFCGKFCTSSPENVTLNDAPCTSSREKQQFCSENCKSSFKKRLSVQNRCDMCYKRSLNSAVPLIRIFLSGEPKQFCDRKCLLMFYQHSNTVHVLSVAKQKSSMDKTPLSEVKTPVKKTSSVKTSTVGINVRLQVRHVAIQCYPNLNTIGTNYSPETTSRSCMTEPVEVNHEVKVPSLASSLIAEAADAPIEKSVEKTPNFLSGKTFVPILIPVPFPVFVPFDRKHLEPKEILTDARLKVGQKRPAQQHITVSKAKKSCTDKKAENITDLKEVNHISGSTEPYEKEISNHEFSNRISVSVNDPSDEEENKSLQDVPVESIEFNFIDEFNLLISTCERSSLPSSLRTKLNSLRAFFNVVELVKPFTSFDNDDSKREVQKTNVTGCNRLRSTSLDRGKTLADIKKKLEDSNLKRRDSTVSEGKDGKILRRDYQKEISSDDECNESLASIQITHKQKVGKKTIKKADSAPNSSNRANLSVELADGRLHDESGVFDTGAVDVISDEMSLKSVSQSNKQKTLSELIESKRKSTSRVKNKLRCCHICPEKQDVSASRDTRSSGMVRLKDSSFASCVADCTAYILGYIYKLKYTSNWSESASNREILDLTDNCLEELLCQFLAEPSSPDKRSPPISVASISAKVIALVFLQFYLSSNGRTCNLFFRQTLAKVSLKLYQLCCAVPSMQWAMPRQCDSRHSSKFEDLLWHINILGTGDAQTLQFTMVYYVTLNFGITDLGSHKLLTRNHFVETTIPIDSSKKHASKPSEVESKKNSDSLSRSTNQNPVQRVVKFKSSGTVTFDDDACRVIKQRTDCESNCALKAYKKYISKVPMHGLMLSLFYMEPLLNYQEDTFWFSKDRIKEQTLSVYLYLVKVLLMSSKSLNRSF